MVITEPKQSVDFGKRNAEFLRALHETAERNRAARTPGRQQALTELIEETLALVIVDNLDVRAHLGSRLAGAESSALHRFCDRLVIHVVP